ncbi:MAG: hypothetical protein KIT22_02245 [Verrucomicrobiae bacterium]|nr:hypothetical protein [Verrucomicrobiae bacterium]
MNTNGTPGGTDGASFAGSPTADDDGDGLSALTEYALGTNDADPASGPDRLDARFAPTGEFQLQITRRLSADEAWVAVDTSEDLVEWKPARLLRSDRVAADQVLDLWSAPGAGTTRGFLRLRVTRP